MRLWSEDGLPLVFSCIKYLIMISESVLQDLQGQRIFLNAVERIVLDKQSVYYEVEKIAELAS
jgi:hypothetical protein